MKYLALFLLLPLCAMAQTINGASIQNGTVTPAKLQASSGSPSSSTFYRGDGAWAAPYINPPAVVSGQVKVASTGVAVCFPSHALVAGNVTVIASPTNAAPVAVGGSGVTNVTNGTGNGYVVQAAGTAPLAASNTSALCVNGTAGDWVSFLGS